jgi:hypothetical protein
VKSDHVTLAQAGTPASIGETVVIYCTGLGAVTRAVKEGSAAQVAFAGLTHAYAGLYQINTVVPIGITTGDAAPVVLSMAGQTSPSVTMAVK